MERRCVVLEHDLNDIESKQDIFGIAEEFQPRQRPARDELLLLPRHRFGWRSERQASPCLHLSKNQCVAVPANQVDFAAMGGAEVAIQDTIAGPLEMARSEPLPFAAEPVQVTASALVRRTEAPPLRPGEKIGDELDKAHVP